MEPFLGQIQPVGFNFPPRGWALCDGQLLPIAQNTALFSLLGTTFGGDGRTTFQLPDLRGRSIVHVGSGPGLAPMKWGQKGGAENITLTSAQLPNHNHAVTATTNDATLDEAAGGTRFGTAGTPVYSATGTGTVALAADSTTNVGGGQSFNNRNPFLGIYVCIALAGIFPSRS
ncbi:MAG: tail Collar domain-containing protein [Saprospiraceae bacterium]|nr:MAG: tail Collar domain-containing protein [Saprospiraceae bacterium]